MKHIVEKEEGIAPKNGAKQIKASGRTTGVRTTGMERRTKQIYHSCKQIEN